MMIERPDDLGHCRGTFESSVNIRLGSSWRLDPLNSISTSGLSPSLRNNASKT